jgi:hypothetical protein
VFGVTAWLLCGMAKLCRLASVVDGGHRTSLARFLSGAEWTAEGIRAQNTRLQGTNVIAACDDDHLLEVLINV